MIRVKRKPLILKKKKKMSKRLKSRNQLMILSKLLIPRNKIAKIQAQHHQRRYGKKTIQGKTRKFLISQKNCAHPRKSREFSLRTAMITLLEKVEMLSPRKML